MIVVFFFVYNVKFSFFSPLGTAKIVDALGAALIVMAMFRLGRLGVEVNKRWLIAGFLLLVLSCYSYIIAVYKGSYDFFNSKAYLALSLDYFFGVIVVVYLANRCKVDPLQGFIKAFVCAALLESLLILAMILFEGFYDYVLSFSGSEFQQHLNERTHGVRGYGLAASLTYDLSILQGMALLFIAYLISQKMKMRTLITYAMISVPIFLSILVSGRSGLIVVMVAVLYMILMAIRTRSALKNTIVFGLLSMSFVFLLVSAASFILAEERLAYVDRVARFAFEFLYAYIEYGRFEVSSVNHLRTMYIDIPVDALFTGHGYFFSPGENRYYLHTDVGYFRDVLFFGLLGSVVLYGVFLYIFFSMILFFKRTGHSGLVWLVVSLCFIYFGAHAKGSFINSAMAPKVVFILFTLCIAQSMRMNRRDTFRYGKTREYSGVFVGETRR